MQNVVGTTQIGNILPEFAIRIEHPTQELEEGNEIAFPCTIRANQHIDRPWFKAFNRLDRFVSFYSEGF
jgi:hypothetical protein